MLTDFRLKVFRAVAERLSFTRAADELFITQPAVTRHINELEKQLGLPLFTRHGNSISLTAQGALLLEYVRRILALYGELNEAFAGEGDTFGGELAVGASTTIAQYVLPAILARFRRRYPAVRIALSDGNTERIERMVSSCELDLALIEGNATSPLLHYETFMEDELVLVTSASNRSLASEEIAAAELPRLPMVIRETGSGTLDVVERALSAHGLSVRSMRVEMQLGSTESIKHYLYGSEAVAFLSVQSIWEELRLDLLRVVEISDLSVTRRFSFVSRHGQNSRLGTLFKQFCLSNYKRTL